MIIKALDIFFQEYYIVGCFLFLFHIKYRKRELERRFIAMKKLGKLLLFGTVIGAAAAGAYYYITKKDSENFDEDFDDFDDLDEEDSEDGDRTYVPLHFNGTENEAAENEDTSDMDPEEAEEDFDKEDPVEAPEETQKKEKIASKLTEGVEEFFDEDDSEEEGSSEQDDSSL